MAGLCFYLSFSILAACLFVIFQCTGKMFFVFLDSLCGIFAGFIERNLVKMLQFFVYCHDIVTSCLQFQSDRFIDI